MCTSYKSYTFKQDHITCNSNCMKFFKNLLQLVHVYYITWMKVSSICYTEFSIMQENFLPNILRHVFFSSQKKLKQKILTYFVSKKHKFVSVFAWRLWKLNKINVQNFLAPLSTLWRIYTTNMNKHVNFSVYVSSGNMIPYIYELSLTWINK